jgi:hypothetical protein
LNISPFIEIRVRIFLGLPSKSALLSIFGGIFEKTELKNSLLKYSCLFWNKVYIFVFNQVDGFYVVKKENFTRTLFFLELPQ